MAGYGFSPATKRTRNGDDNVPFGSVAAPYFPGMGAEASVRPSYYWQHPTHVAACLDQDTEDALAFERKMKQAQNKLPGGTESWIGKTDVYRDKCGQWTRRLVNGKLTPKRELYLYYVTGLREGRREYEVPPLHAEDQQRFAHELLSDANRALYLALLHRRASAALAAGLPQLRAWALDARNHAVFRLDEDSELCSTEEPLQTHPNSALKFPLRFARHLCDVVTAMQAPVLLPTFKMLTGEWFGSPVQPRTEPEPESGAKGAEPELACAEAMASLLEQAHFALGQYYLGYSSPEYKRSELAKTAGINIAEQFAQQEPVLKTVIFGASGHLAGEELRTACAAILAGGAPANLPELAGAMVAKAQIAAESLLVLSPQMQIKDGTARQRPPFFTFLSHAGDAQGESERTQILRFKLGQATEPSKVRAKREKIDKFYVEKLRAEMKRVIAANVCDFWMITFDNADWAAGGMGYMTHANDSHCTNSEVFQLPRFVSHQFPFSDPSPSRPWDLLDVRLSVPALELRNKLHNWRGEESFLPKMDFFEATVLDCSIEKLLPTTSPHLNPALDRALPEVYMCRPLLAPEGDPCEKPTITPHTRSPCPWPTRTRSASCEQSDLQARLCHIPRRQPENAASVEARRSVRSRGLRKDPG